MIYRVPLRARGHVFAAPLVEAADWPEARDKAAEIGRQLTERSELRVVVGIPRIEPSSLQVAAQMARKRQPRRRACRIRKLG